MKYIAPDKRSIQINVRSTLIISEVQGTLSNTSWYPYSDISDLQNWRKMNRTTTFHKWVCNLTPEVKDIMKILWKRGGAISPHFHNILLPVVRFPCLTGTRFSLRDKQLFEIREIEITSWLYFFLSTKTYDAQHGKKGPYTIWEQQKSIWACVSVQSDLSILCSSTYTKYLLIL